MPVTITTTELQELAPGLSTAAAQTMIDGALARATRLAPCLTAADFPHAAAAKSILMDVLLRRVDSGTGVIMQESVGPHSRTFAQGSSARSLFWPTEIAELQALCATAPVDVTSSGTTKPDFYMPPADAEPWLPVFRP